MRPAYTFRYIYYSQLPFEWYEHNIWGIKLLIGFGSLCFGLQFCFLFCFIQQRSLMLGNLSSRCYQLGRHLKRTFRKLVSMVAIRPASRLKLTQLCTIARNVGNWSSGSPTAMNNLFLRNIYYFQHIPKANCCIK